jgi:ferredoxin
MRRFRAAAGELLQRLITPGTVAASAFVPTTPRFLRESYTSPRKAWDVDLPPIPEELLTVPGIRRDPVAEEAAFGAEPLHDFHQVHAEAIWWETRREWASLVPVAPRLARVARAVARTARVTPRPPSTPDEPGALKSACAAEARKLGLGAIGVTEYDPKYTFAQHEGHQCGDRVIVCLLEQNYEATQRTPSVLTNRAAYDSEAEVQHLAVKLAGFLHRRGYRAKAHATHEAAMIPYAVAAGLGQLGLNGQLLTPAAGSRCRLAILTTEAPLPFDRPVDYGVTAICDACQACVRRCPAGAIPRTRSMYRGIEKAKINTQRCFPVTAQAAGCGICMKVCPVQRYGLRAVLEEYARSGRILGNGTDELEGYDWPFDGRHYGPSERPALSREFFNPPGLNFDPARKLPLIKTRQH